MIMQITNNSSGAMIANSTTVEPDWPLRDRLPILRFVVFILLPPLRHLFIVLSGAGPCVRLLIPRFR